MKKLKTWEEQLNSWLEAEALDESLAQELMTLAARRDHKAQRELEERFYKELEFGTSGLRGILGAGTNRVNIHTVRKIVQGLCDYIAEDLGAFDDIDIFERTLVMEANLEKAPAVAVAYDSRINSRLFAEAAAGVFAANGIRVYMYDVTVPVAALSFAVRKLGCSAGIMITASHNPADYNGIKIYNANGCQVMPGEQRRISARINALDVFADVSYLDFGSVKNSAYFTFLGDETIEEYINCIMAQRLSLVQETEQEVFAALKVLYTPLNGGGLRPMCTVAERTGIGAFEVVKTQEKPDGRFPTCHSPNPETDEAFEEALKAAKTMRPDIIVATDPDCDRFGVMVKLENGMYRKLSGNEAAIIVFDYIVRSRKADAHTNAESGLTAIRSLTATAFADIIADKNGIEMQVIPNGSSYLGAAMEELVKSGREDDFIFSFEDTNQCLSGTYARDEDGILGALHIISAAAFAKSEGKNLADVLDELYKQYGYFESDSVSIAFSGIEGLRQRDEIMKNLRCILADEKQKSQHERNKIAGMRVEMARDYFEADSIFPQFDAIEFKLENNAGAIIRPSGTEPKLKLYMYAAGCSSDAARETCKKVEHAMLEIVQNDRN